MSISEKLHKINKYLNNIDSTVKYIYRAPDIDSSFGEWKNTILNNDPIPSNKYVEEELVELSSVNFYDYDGTVLYAYDKDEFLSLTELPPLPSQPGLTCQGWNWSLEDAQEYVDKYDNLNIGATYTTDDGKTRFYIELVNDNTKIHINFSQVTSGNITIDWGDGSSETASGKDSKTVYHTYSTKGEYIIKLDSGVSSIDNDMTYILPPNTYLKKVEIGNSVTSIGRKAFSDCHSLQSVTIPNSVTVIDYYAFESCTPLRSVTIPNSVKTIGTDAFSGCDFLQNVIIGNSVTTINTRAFGSCDSLQSITIPDSVTTINGSAFESCTSLPSITIPDSVTSIDEYAFRYCSSLQSITIPDSVTSISRFQSCTSLQSITIPDSVTSIGKYTFEDCYSLRNVNVGNSVTSIGTYAFASCDSLQYIDFTSHTSIPTLDANTFNDTKSDFEIWVPYKLYDDWCNATNWAKYKNKIKHGLMDVAASTCNSLSITADDVSGKATNTTIYYTANANYINKWTGEVETVDIVGTAISDPFPQNTSTTDTVERTITFELGGLTATTTITQGVWVDKEYIINLNNQWQLSSKPNPDSSLYDGVYESFSNYNIHNSYATMYIDIVGYETFKLYIRSYAESNYDYVMVSQLDQNITGDTSYSNTTLVKAHTRGKSTSGTALSNYTLVEFTGIDKGEHRITIVYRKDVSSNGGDDRGYVFVENK